MKWMCTRCEIISKNEYDKKFDDCRSNRHEIMSFLNDDVEEEKVFFYEIAEKILKKYDFVYRISELYFYDKEAGYWMPGGEKLVSAAARKIWYGKIQNKHISEVIGVIKDLVPYDREGDYFIPDYTNRYMVCVKNGVINLKTGELLPFDKKYRFLSKLSVYYDGKARCPKFIKFLKSSLEEDPVKIYTVLEMIGHTLLRDNNIISKIFLHVGKGSNGKSILFGIIQGLLGRRGYSSKTLESLAYSNFAGSDVIGKHANICADIGSSEIKQTDQLKRISAGDVIDNERKYHQGFPDIPYCTMIFSANELPDVKDETDGFARRIEVIEWIKSFYGVQKDPTVTRIKDTPEELSGILNWILPIIVKMIDRGSLKYEKTVDEMRLIYKEKSDSVFLFVNELCGSKSEYEVRTVQLYTAYVKYIKEFHPQYTLQTMQKFTNSITSKGYGKRKANVKGDHSHYFTGIMLRADIQSVNTTL